MKKNKSFIKKEVHQEHQKHCETAMGANPWPKSTKIILKERF